MRERSICMQERESSVMMREKSRKYVYERERSLRMIERSMCMRER